MSKNQLKVVNNPYTNEISYFFRNEKGEWIPLSSNSYLSRRFFSKTNLEERAWEIIKEIDHVYNRKDRGVDIYFEGNNKNFQLFRAAVYCYKASNNVDINCFSRSMVIAVVGKKCVGKTTLIKAIENAERTTFTSEQGNEYTKYEDSTGNKWYEVKGIDLIPDSVDNAFSTIESISGLSTILYCVSGDTGKIEDSELVFLSKLKNKYPDFHIVLVLTQCSADDYVNLKGIVKDKFGDILIIETLAKELKTRNNKKMDSFGIKDLIDATFKGRIDA